MALPSPTWSRTRGSSKPIDNSGKNFLLTYGMTITNFINTNANNLNSWNHPKDQKGNVVHTSITISSISQMSICSTDLWRDISLRTPPSPPPITKNYINHTKKWKLVTKVEKPATGKKIEIPKLHFLAMEWNKVEGGISSPDKRIRISPSIARYRQEQALSRIFDDCW